MVRWIPGRHQDPRDNPNPAERQAVYRADMGPRKCRSSTRSKLWFCPAGMTKTRCTLDPIRPHNGEVGDDMQLGGAESEQGQVEVRENVENIRDVDEDRAEADEDVRRPKPVARLYTPTRTEVYEHEVTHLPYRNWCKHCVHGRGVSSPHQKRTRRKILGSQSVWITALLMARMTTIQLCQGY